MTSAMRDIRFPLPASYCLARPAFTLFFPIDVVALDGRPLMENRTLEHAHLCTPSAVCQYPDYRAAAGLPINIGALQAFNRSGNAITHVVRRMGAMVGRGSVSLRGLWMLSKVSIASTTQLALRELAGASDREPIPAADAALYKVCRGLNQLVEIMCREGYSPSENWTTADILDFVDRRRLLVGRSESCAAPRVLIQRVLEEIRQALLDGLDESATPRDLEFAALYSIMERVCFLYTVARCAALLRSGYDPKHVRARPTFAGAVEARSLASAGEIEQKRALDHLLTLNFSCTYPALEEELCRVVGSVPRLLDESLPWPKFFDQCFRMLSELNVLVAGFSLFNTPVRPLQRRDVELFLGPGPQVVGAVA
jgi:hypothetical protein